jgi:type I site-specific restriction-modification system R (restriction) subunit
MMFFAQKVLVVSDRVELDGQIAKTFKATGA